jgi:hypothetical protein
MDRTVNFGSIISWRFPVELICLAILACFVLDGFVSFGFLCHFSVFFY